MNETKKQFLTRVIWCKIRYFQQLHSITNERLAENLNVHPWTLSAYDKSAKNVTLGQLESFLKAYAITLDELLAQ